MRTSVLVSKLRSIPLLVSILPFLVATTAAVGAVSSPPAEVDNLQVAGNSIQWDVTGSAVSYRVYRAGRADLPNFCALDSRLVEVPAFNDPQQPAIGTVRPEFRVTPSPMTRAESPRRSVSPLRCWPRNVPASGSVSTWRWSTPC